MRSFRDIKLDYETLRYGHDVISSLHSYVLLTSGRRQLCDGTTSDHDVRPTRQSHLSTLSAGTHAHTHAAVHIDRQHRYIGTPRVKTAICSTSSVVHNAPPKKKNGSTGGVPIYSNKVITDASDVSARLGYCVWRHYPTANRMGRYRTDKRNREPRVNYRIGTSHEKKTHEDVLCTRRLSTVYYAIPWSSHTYVCTT